MVELRPKIKPINKKVIAIWNEEFDVDFIFYSFPNCDHFCLIIYQYIYIMTSSIQLMMLIYNREKEDWYYYGYELYLVNNRKRFCIIITYTI